MSMVSEILAGLGVLLALVAGFFKFRAGQAAKRAAVAEDQVHGYEAAQVTQDQATAGMRAVRNEAAKQAPIDPQNRTGLEGP